MDREKVIKGLECIQWKGEICGCCPYNSTDFDNYGRKKCKQSIATDAIYLLKEQEKQIRTRDESLEKAREEIKWFQGMLKEQEAIKPIPPTDESDLWRCGGCNHQLFRCTRQRYCEMCGQEVKWDG